MDQKTSDKPNTINVHSHAELRKVIKKIKAQIAAQLLEPVSPSEFETIEAAKAKRERRSERNKFNHARERAGKRAYELFRWLVITLVIAAGCASRPGLVVRVPSVSGSRCSCDVEPCVHRVGSRPTPFVCAYCEETCTEDACLWCANQEESRALLTRD